MTALENFIKEIVLRRDKGSVYLVPAICDFQIADALEEEKKQGQSLPGDHSDVSGISTDLEKDLFVLVNKYMKAGLSKPHTVARIEWVLGSVKKS